MIMNTLQAKTSIQPLELQRLLAEGRPAQLVDVRTPVEFATAHVPGAKLIPLGDLDPAAFRRERGVEGIPVYVLCQSGGRARKAIEKLEQAGVHGCVLVRGLYLQECGNCFMYGRRQSGQNVPLPRRARRGIGPLEVDRNQRLSRAGCSLE